MRDQDFLITKNQVMEKTFGLLGTVESKLESLFKQSTIPTWYTKKSSKISRGEQYQGLPYMILDYPRIFEHEHVLAFRVLFWWGNFFSATLHLGGKYLDQYRDKLLERQNLIRQTPNYFCISDDPWQYHYSHDYYQPAHGMEAERLDQALLTRSFIKISQKWSLEDYGQLPDLVATTWENMMSIIGQKE